MLPDNLPQLIDALLRLPHIEAGQLRELIQHLPDPQAAAQEMVRRGWITQNQYSSLFPDPQPRPTPQETMLVGFGVDESPPDAEDDDWGLTVSDDEAKADVPPDIEWAQPDRTNEEMLPEPDPDDWGLTISDDEAKADVPPEVEWAQPDRTNEEMLPEPETVEPVLMLAGAASTPQFEWAVLVPPVAGGNEARRQESDTDKCPRQGMGWASKGLLMGTLFLGTLFLGSLFALLPFFGANSTVPPVAHQESREAKVGDPARAVALPPVPQIVPINNAKQRDDPLNGTGQNAPPAAPVAVAPAAPVGPPPAQPAAPAAVAPAAQAPVTAAAPAQANDAKPKATASLYARVRQVVRENKTEETDRLGIGDFPYQHVPDDGSILVGLEVTYAPFFTHHIIKSVRPIYQRPDGWRYDGPVCGTPTGVGERVVAKDGYAIGAAAIKAGMGIDGIQLTFMEIGAEELNPDKTYLSKWLGGYGGAAAQTFVNDGRPIVGIAGMRSKNPKSPAFCLCLVTTQAGALAAADGLGDPSPLINNPKQRGDLLKDTGPRAQPAAPVPGKPASRPPQLYTIVMTVGDQTVTRTVQLDENGAVVPEAGSVAAPPAGPQWAPRPQAPQPVDAFEQRVRRQIREAQKRMREAQKRK